MVEEKEKPLTRNDVLKLIEENGGKTGGLDLSGRVFEKDIDLSNINLLGINLKDAHLQGADFSGSNLEWAKLPNAHLNGCLMEGAKLNKASLWGAHLVEADLTDASLKEADLHRAHLKYAILHHVDFENSNLEDADLEGARLFKANLKGAKLYGANLRETDLSFANLAGANLDGAQFDETTKLQGATWGDYIIGEEIDGKLDWAIDAYRQLKTWYTNAGISDIAAKFYYREKEANRKALKWRSKNWNHRLALELLRALFGYGEDWKRVLYWMAAVIFGLAAVYYFWGSFSSSSFWDTLYYSAASFTALGYGQWAPQPTGWAKGMGAAEAIIGVFMMALLLVTFVRKWTR